MAPSGLVGELDQVEPGEGVVDLLQDSAGGEATQVDGEEPRFPVAAAGLEPATSGL
jgi:hypothetical protein